MEHLGKLILLELVELVFEFGKDLWDKNKKHELSDEAPSLCACLDHWYKTPQDNEALCRLVRY